MPGSPGLTSQLTRFAAIGLASTCCHLGLYLLLRDVLGALTANLVALLVTAIVNTAANRRLTFGVRGRRGAGRHQVQGLLVLALGLALTSAALTLLELLAPDAGRVVEVCALVIANSVATVARFALFRSWVFSGAHDRAEPAEEISRGGPRANFSG